MKPFIGVAFIFLENYQYIELHQEVENFGEKNLKQKIMYDAYNNIEVQTLKIFLSSYYFGISITFSTNTLKTGWDHG